MNVESNIIGSSLRTLPLRGQGLLPVYLRRRLPTRPGDIVPIF